jgi:hypothetical protein
MYDSKDVQHCQVSGKSLQERYAEDGANDTYTLVERRGMQIILHSSHDYSSNRCGG